MNPSGVNFAYWTTACQTDITDVSTCQSPPSSIRLLPMDDYIPHTSEINLACWECSIRGITNFISSNHLSLTEFKLCITFPTEWLDIPDAFLWTLCTWRCLDLVHVSQVVPASIPYHQHRLDGLRVMHHTNREWRGLGQATRSISLIRDT